MIYARPDSTVYSVLRGAASGQVGTITVALRRLADSALVVPPATAGITEQDPGGTYSNYTGAIAIPADVAAGVYQAEWVYGGETYTDEELITVNATGAADLRVGYATVTDVRLVLAPDGSEDPTLGTAASLSDVELGEAIAEAASEIDAKLADRYTVPFPDPVPEIVNRIARDIAAYLATLTYRRGNPVPADDPVRLRYTRARDLLDAAAQGKVDLVDASGPTGQTDNTTVVNPYDGDLFVLDDFQLGPAPPDRRWPHG